MTFRVFVSSFFVNALFAPSSDHEVVPTFTYVEFRITHKTAKNECTMSTSKTNFFNFSFFKNNKSESRNKEDGKTIVPFKTDNKFDIVDTVKYAHFCEKYGVRKSLVLIFGQSYITYPVISFRKVTQKYFCQIYIDYVKCIKGPFLDEYVTLDYIEFVALYKAVERDFYLYQLDLFCVITKMPKLSSLATMTHYFQIVPLGMFLVEAYLHQVLFGPYFRLFKLNLKGFSIISLTFAYIQYENFSLEKVCPSTVTSLYRAAESTYQYFKYGISNHVDYINKHCGRSRMFIDLMFLFQTPYSHKYGAILAHDMLLLKFFSSLTDLEYVRVSDYYDTMPRFFDVYMPSTTWGHAFVLGSFFYVLSGGESNPGPVFSRLINAFVPQVQNMRDTYRHAADVSSSCKDILIVSIYLNRMSDQLFQFVSTLTKSSVTSTFELFTKTSSLLITLYETHNVVMDKLHIRMAHITPQGGDMQNFVLGMGLASFLPKCLKSIFKDVQVFSNLKLLDDLNIFQEFIALIISLPRRIFELFEYTGLNSKIVSAIINTLKVFEGMIPLGELGVLNSNLQTLIEKHQKNHRLHCDPDFQNEVLKHQSAFMKQKNFYLFNKRVLPSYFVNTANMYEKLLKLVKFAKTDTRPEPVALVFCGPPGTGKSCLTSSLINSYKGTQTIYVDTPTDMQKKKFYDAYQNEDIYVVDDMGAKAVSQWSEIVNQVSTVKYKLECAQIENKDAKFFTSSLMIISCNSIPTPNVILPTDGLKDIEAFYRRLHVVSFDKVKFEDGEYSGLLEVKRYNRAPGVKQWEVIESHNINGTPGVIKFVDAYTRKQMNIQNNVYNNLSNSSVLLQPLPIVTAQGKITDTVYSGMRSFCKRFPFGVTLFDFLIDGLGDANQFLERHFPDLAKLADDYDVSSVTLVLLVVCCGMIIGGIGSVIYDYFNTPEDEVVFVPASHKSHQSSHAVKEVVKVIPQGVSELLNIVTAVDEPPPQLKKYQDNVVVLKIIRDLDGGTESICCGLMSVDKIIVPYHSVFSDKSDKVFFTAYSKGNTILYDKMEANVVFRSEVDDLAVLQLSRVAPRYFKKLKINVNSNNDDLYMLFPSGSFGMAGKISQLGLTLKYNTGSFFRNLLPTDLTYTYAMDGLCGTWMVNADGMLVAMHVAQVDFKREGGNISEGVAHVIHKSTLIEIQKLLDVSFGQVLPIVPGPEDFSGARIDVKEPNFVNNKSSIVPSLIHGVFPIERKPAEIKNKSKMLELSLDAYCETPSLPLIPIQFAAAVLEEKLSGENQPVFEGLTEQVLVNGDDVLNRVDPKTSVGSGYDGKKSDWIDYEKSCLRPNMKDRIVGFCDSIIKGNFQYDEYYTTTFKDELRNVDNTGKIKDPRLFQAGTILLTLMYRFFFGELMVYTMKRRFKNGIMVGLNPLSKEWDNFAKKILRRSPNNIYDGDYKWWDKRMHPMLQRMLTTVLKKIIRPRNMAKKFNEIFLTKYTEDDIEVIFDMIMELVISTPTKLLNLIIITTHNMPSGIGITAFYNSCINLMITAYVYYVRCSELGGTPSISSFISNVDDYVYGDDKLLVCSDSFKKFMDPYHYARIVKTMDLDFTKADKTSWTEGEYATLDKVTFLKRSFYFHPKLAQYVAPLEKRSMQSTLNYISDGVRDVELTTVKMENFQREAYLHYFDYISYMSHVTKAAEEADLEPRFLSQELLLRLYNDDQYGENLILQ